MPATAEIRKFLNSLLLPRRLQISQTTEVARLGAFFDLVKPITTNFDLVRIGGEGDGGYLVPDDLAGIEACFSPGVADTADFELDFANRGVKCFLADYSVDSPPIKNDRFAFEKNYLGPTEDAVHITLENWVKRKAPDSNDLILQMDIEGGEYGVLFDTGSDTLRQFRIMVIEFHNLDKLHDKSAFELINLSFRKIRKDFDVVHIHPNNCITPFAYENYEIPPVVEFTFLRNDRISARRPTTTFPHPLDRRNVPHNADYPLPSCWHAKES